jgi:tetratricopeptide (TPR) repeat protein
MNLNDPFGLNKYFAEMEAFRRMLELADPLRSLPGFADEQKRLQDLATLTSNPARDIVDRIQADAARYDQLLHQAGQFDEQLKALQKSVVLDGVWQAIGPHLTQLDALKPFWDSMTVARDLEQWNARAFPEFQIDWEAARERFAKALTFAAKHGWFVTGERDEDMSLPIEDCGDDVETLDQLFEEHVESLADSIDARLQQDFASRKEFIAEAFALFRERRYAAAIPLLFLTADGIAHDTAGKSAFSTTKTSEGRATGLAAWVEKQLDDSGLEPYIDQLAKSHGLSTSTASRFSRHGVLHGRDLDYGTRRNALQAISFLGFLGWVVVEVRGATDPPADA